ncbi:hypothetical protein M409DRAFT_23713 [Zasmidium cellare ATCC 36951]|uniref:F-box domain-containing protein n=1 Tax=Zasmidium cellare ATCC 36951 TaxID=1080233 RepID=A0A6A6CKP0_ZASCE|nr:uncharacterized protein M409DRAFT_23713 [Zasmidium cellare ATCC 36951]KAF2165986.1 hypothetical protein M409DRAFT_23713 [Zasmidium cellare ATCC 36951]
MTSQTKPTFLPLPQELRDIIYEYAFTDHVDLRGTVPHNHNMGLLSTSKQIRAESLPLYFSFSTFTVSTGADCVQFLKQIPQNCHRFVKNVQIEHPCPNCKRNEHTPFQLHLATLRIRREMVVTQRACSAAQVENIYVFLATECIILSKGVLKCRVYVWNGKNVCIWTSKPE